MNTAYHAASNWIQSHPTSFTLILFVSACIVSVYSSFIRRFLAIPPQRLGTWILMARIEVLEFQLDRLRECNRNTHALLRIGLIHFSLTLLVILGLMISTWTEVLILHKHSLHPEYSIAISASDRVADFVGIVLVAAIATRLTLFSMFLLRLGSFEESESNFVDKLAGLERKLNDRLPPPDEGTDFVGG